MCHTNRHTTIIFNGINAFKDCRLSVQLKFVILNCRDKTGIQRNFFERSRDIIIGHYKVHYRGQYMVQYRLQYRGHYKEQYKGQVHFILETLEHYNCRGDNFNSTLVEQESTNI